MEEKKNNHDNQQSGSGPERTDENVEGRLYNSQNPEFRDKDSRDDISHVDEQEGTMNNGVIGANIPPDVKTGPDQKD